MYGSVLAHGNGGGSNVKLNNVDASGSDDTDSCSESIITSSPGNNANSADDEAYGNITLVGIVPGNGIFNRG